MIMSYSLSVTGSSDLEGLPKVIFNIYHQNYHCIVHAFIHGCVSLVRIMTNVVNTIERRLLVTVTSPGSCMNSRLHVMYGCLTWVMGLVPIELSKQPEWD